MSKVVSEKKSNSFVKGLITEASALTFPENASLDEDNFDLLLNGSRVRRLGIDYESDYSLTATGIDAGILSGTKTSFHRWDFPGGSTTESIGVVRAYNRLWFMNLLTASPSSNLLNGGTYITISGLANSEIETAVINNLFVIVSPDLDYPVILEYNKTTQLVSQSFFPIQVRDIWGVNDGLTAQERPSDLSETHWYNLINQGWSDTISSICFSGNSSTGYTKTTYVLKSLGDGSLRYWAWEEVPVVDIGPVPTALQCTKTTIGVYPSNSDLWTLGKVASSISANFEKYDPNSLVKNSIDNTDAPKGSFILDAFKRGASRIRTTGLSTLPTDEETGRLSCITSYAGRMWYSGVTSSVSLGDTNSPNYSGFIFFSQVVTGKDKLGKCYQEADPTSPNISDIIDTDGGTIHIPEVSKIVKLVAIKDSLLIFAENGIWEVYGDTGGFKATSFQISKISNIGVSNPNTIISTGGMVVYWNKSGISVAVPNPQTGRYEEQNISLTTIQSFYTDSISDLSKKYARGFYDEIANRVYWLYNDTSSYIDGNNVNYYNKQLCLDLTLKAFFKYTISPLAVNSPYITAVISLPPHAITTSVEDVYVDNTKVNVSTNQVQTHQDISISRLSKYSFLTFIGTSFTISQYNNDSFIDWKLADSIGIDYSSYLVTGYDTFGDTMRNKQVPYIFFQFNRTETGFETSGSNLIAKNPSGCLVQAQWNWSNSATGGKWGTAFQAYRYKRNYSPSGVSDTYDTGDAVIETKNKLRGSGKALSLKIQSEAGKDMQLLGWSYTITGDGTP